MKEVVLDKIDSCRLCKHKVSLPVIDLGELALTGMFGVEGSKISKCSLSLTRCLNEDCGLLQLMEVYDLSLLYGDYYGYASSLNSSMVKHLESKATEIKNKLQLIDGDIVIDIGSNDGTTLSFFSDGVRKIGVDVVGKKYIDNYEAIGATLVDDFFPSPMVSEALNGGKARLISSYSCFYDLPNPLEFAAGISSHLASDGIWVLEQSYLGSMLESNSFDTICHEHIEYYRLCDIGNICRSARLKIIDVSVNDINGGSFSVQVAHECSKYIPSAKVSDMLSRESSIDWGKEIESFSERVLGIKSDLVAMLDSLAAAGNSIYGLGASTKGNVLLQFFGLDNEYIKAIGEVNADKFGCETPGTCIPIMCENLLLAKNPDYLLVLPWHFKQHFMTNPKYKGRKLIFPLPYPIIKEN